MLDLLQRSKQTVGATAEAVDVTGTSRMWMKESWVAETRTPLAIAMSYTS